MNVIAETAPQSIKLLCNNILDYAGIFPPASLDLHSAFLNYVKYLDSNENWMLSKFIVPAKKLNELSTIIENDKLIPKNKIKLSILGGSDVVLSNFFDNLKVDINYISEFLSKFGSDYIADTFEVRIPLELFVIPNKLKLVEFFTRVSAEFFNKLKINFSFFYEAIPNKDLTHLSEAISYYNISGNFCGYKMRTGGVEVSSFPLVEKISQALKICAENQTPIKCTAGLHHPFRHYNNEVKTKMHGFINVFLAGIFVYTLGINEYHLTLLMLEENKDNFQFTADSIKWENFEVFKEEISHARENFILSFGSCSLEEPVNDLKSLKLL